MLWRISYRFKIPLGLSLAILLTGLVVTVALTWRAYEDLRDDLFRNAVEVGAVLSNTLPSALKHDDLWQAYQILDAAAAPAESRDGRLFIVLDHDYRVYVSNQPLRFPVRSELRVQEPELARLELEVRRGRSLQPYAFDDRDSERIYVILPMVEDGVALGTLIIGYSRSLFLPRFYGIVQRVALSSLAVMAVLVPFGWYLGKRMAAPLAKVVECLAEVGRKPPDQIQCSLCEGQDEIGKLGIRCKEMVRELQEKQRLAGEMVASERLAAVGRLAAGVAHEINNPLGGMINAISTYKRHGWAEPVTDKTLSLLERGLEQIRETVSALLVEARSQSHALTPRDVDDVHMLLQPDAHKKALRVTWDNALREPLPLPSTPIRQVLINLSLNAVQAAPEGAAVECRICRERDMLCIDVDNESDGIAPDQTDMLFEPFVHQNPEGNGLGLWVTYQIVQQLHGDISVRSAAGHTRFTVRLPLEAAA